MCCALCPGNVNVPRLSVRVLSNRCTGSSLLAKLLQSDIRKNQIKRAVAPQLIKAVSPFCIIGHFLSIDIHATSGP